MKGKVPYSLKELELEEIIQMVEPKQEKKIFGGYQLKAPELSVEQCHKIIKHFKQANQFQLQNKKTIKQQNQQILHQENIIQSLKQTNQNNITNLIHYQKTIKDLKQILQQKSRGCYHCSRIHTQLNKIYQNKSLSVQSWKEDPQAIKAIVSYYNNHRQLINGKFKALGYTNDVGFWAELSAVTQKYLKNNIKVETNHGKPMQKYTYLDQKDRQGNNPPRPMQQDKITQPDKTHDQMLKEKQQQINGQLYMIRCIQEQLELSNNSELIDFICKIQSMKNDLTKKSEENAPEENDDNMRSQHTSQQNNQDSQQEYGILTENKCEKKEEQMKQIISQIIKLDLQIHQHKKPLSDSQVGVKVIKEIFDDITTSVERMHQQLWSLRAYMHQQRAMIEKQRASIGQQRAGNIKTKQQLEEKLADLYQQCSKLSSDNTFLRQKIQQLEGIISKLSSLKQQESQSIQTLNSQKENYQGTIRQLRATLATLKSKNEQTIEQLTTKLSEVNSHADKLKGQNRELSLLAQQLSDKLSASERNNQGLKAELDDLKLKQSESKKKIGQLQLECQEMKKKDEQNDVQVNNLTLALTKKEQQAQYFLNNQGLEEEVIKLKEERRNLLSQITKLKKQNQTITFEIRDKQQKISSLKAQKNQLERDIINSRKAIKDTQEQEKAQGQKLAVMVRQSEKVGILVIQLQEKQQRSKNNIEKLRKEKGEIERILSQKEEQLREIEESIGKVSVMVKKHDERQRKQGKEEQEKVEGYGKVLEELEEKIKASEEALASLIQQIQLHTSKLSQVKQELSGLESQKQEITKATQAREDLDRQYDLRMDQLNDLQHKINTRKNKLATTPKKEQRQSSQMNLQIEKLQNIIKMKDKEVQELNAKVQRKQEQLKNMSQKNTELTQINQSLEVKQVISDHPIVKQPKRSLNINPELRPKERETSRPKNFRIHKLDQVTLKNTQDKIQLPLVVQDDKANIYSSFNGKIKLSQELKEVIHSKILSSYSNNAFGQINYQIANTELLYFFPEMRKLNFHEQVDEKINIVVIVKLKNTDHIIVAYSQPMLSSVPQGAVNHLGGFLGVFKEKEPSKNYKFFPLNKKSDKARPLPYNAYYLVIGNSELRIKRETNKVESNIPTTFQYFETPGETSPAFMFGFQAKETEVQRYEIYQLTMSPI